MNRRGFLKALGLAAVGVAAAELVPDPERLLWVPGSKRIFDLGENTPRVTLAQQLALKKGDVITIDGVRVGGELRQFVVTDVTPDGSAALEPSIPDIGPDLNLHWEEADDNPCPLNDEPLPAEGDVFVTADWITREALKVFEKNLEFSRMVTREYEHAFRTGMAQRVALPKPKRFA